MTWHTNGEKDQKKLDWILDAVNEAGDNARRNGFFRIALDLSKVEECYREESGTGLVIESEIHWDPYKDPRTGMASTDPRGLSKRRL